MSAKHTPTPWFYDQQYKNSALVSPVQTPDEEPWSDMCIECHSTGDRAEDEANAEFIVRACNSYDALLEACRQSLKWCDDVYPADIFTGESGDSQAIRIRNIREGCRKAIAEVDNVSH